MKKIIYFLLSLTPLLLSSCSDDDDKVPSLTPTERGTVTDNDGNTYGWVRIGNLRWTTSNAKNGPGVWECRYYTNFEWTYVFDSYGSPSKTKIKDFTENYMPVYGNLMNYDGAVASAPDGWRLPTDDDWKDLERALGMNDADNMGMRGNGQAFRLQEKDGGTELAMQLGGGFILTPSYGVVNLPLDYEGVFGYYWTSTLDPDCDKDEPKVYFRKFFNGKGVIWREFSTTQQLMSVRWVQDVK